jgi:predicted ester cyclase
MIEAERLREFATQYTAAWCSRDATRVASHYSLNGSLRINDGAPALGRDAITATAQEFMTAFPDLQVVMNDLGLEDEYPKYRWTLRGTNNGPGGTGKRVCISGFEVWRIGEDGLIAESSGHFDSANYQRQLQGCAK